MFPVQLMTVRRSNKDGTVKNTFLFRGSLPVVSRIVETFHRSIGRTRSEILNSLKEFELRSQNPKVIRGLVYLLFRLSTLERASALDPEKVRMEIFRTARSPSVNVGERLGVLKKVAEKMGTTVEEIENAIYADLEDNLILRKVPAITPPQLLYLYNSEQIETVIMKSQWIQITLSENYGRLVRKIRSLGLLYSHTENGNLHTLKVSGPVSVLEHSERYGIRLALLVKYLLHLAMWELDAIVSLRDGREKRDYRYHIDDSVREFTGISPLQMEKLPSFVHDGPDPLERSGVTIFPDYELVLDGRKTYVIVTRPRYLQEDILTLKMAGVEQDECVTVCLLEGKEKCPPGTICFRDRVDWYALRDRLLSYESKGRKVITSAHKTRREKLEQVNNNNKEIDEKSLSHLRKLFPDTDAMIDFLEFKGFPVIPSLQRAGFKVSWKGLRLIIEE